MPKRANAVGWLYTRNERTPTTRRSARFLQAQAGAFVVIEGMTRLLMSILAAAWLAGCATGPESSSASQAPQATSAKKAQQGERPD
jgi:hypothetical protein